MHPAIFLDRDGVIIENNPAYVRSWDDVIFIPNSLSALAQLRHSSYKIVIVTNQSAVGRGILSTAEAADINLRLVDKICRNGGRIDGVYMCPHAPKDSCHCRKPKPGLLLEAARELDLDLEKSILIGDAISDLQAGQAAGLKHTILVRTGRGKDQEKLARPQDLLPFHVNIDLADVVQSILSSAQA